MASIPPPPPSPLTDTITIPVSEYQHLLECKQILEQTRVPCSFCYTRKHTNEECPNKWLRCANCGRYGHETSPFCSKALLPSPSNEPPLKPFVIIQCMTCGGYNHTSEVCTRNQPCSNTTIKVYYDTSTGLLTRMESEPTTIETVRTMLEEATIL
jgi:hypothetical protein